jgi:hypothetical protein
LYLIKKEKKLANKAKVEITITATVAYKPGVDIKKMLKEETEYLLEPQSANGCVLKTKFKSLKII